MARPVAIAHAAKMPKDVTTSFFLMVQRIPILTKLRAFAPILAISVTSSADGRLRHTPGAILWALNPKQQEQVQEIIQEFSNI